MEKLTQPQAALILPYMIGGRIDVQPPSTRSVLTACWRLLISWHRHVPDPAWLAFFFRQERKNRLFSIFFYWHSSFLF